MARVSKREASNNFQRITVILTVIFVRGIVADPLCLEGDFDSQVRHLLTSQMLTKIEIANISTVFQDLQESLQTKWPGSEVIPIGSLSTGLAIKSSDADCMVKVPHYTVYNVTANKYLILLAVQVLRQQPHLYDNVRAKFRARNKISLLKFRYIHTQKNCDVNFISTRGLEISKMIAFYYRLDDRAWKMAALIKIWTKIHRINKEDMFTSYTLNLLIIFYLQQVNIVPAFHLLQSLDRHRAIEHWKESSGDRSRSTLYHLLGGFFKYYSEFNFVEYVVSPLVGRPIHKSLFKDTDSLPDELSSYKNYVRSPNSKRLVLNKKLCVQDVFPPYLNTEEYILPLKMSAFMLHVKFAAEQLKMLSSERFLTSILVENKYDAILDSDEVQKNNHCYNSSH